MALRCHGFGGQARIYADGLDSNNFRDAYLAGSMINPVGEEIFLEQKVLMLRPVASSIW